MKTVKFFVLVIIGLCILSSASASAQQIPNQELVGMLTSKLNISPDQAVGGAGAIFGLAKTRMSGADFGKLSSAVPGMDGFLNAAPSTDSGSSPFGGLGGKLPKNAGGLASLAGSFKSIGLSPDMASKFVPIMQSYISSKGGSQLGSLFGGALK